MIIWLRCLRDYLCSNSPVSVSVFEDDGEVGGSDEVWVIAILCFR
jgi:hypothetical protein